MAERQALLQEKNRLDEQARDLARLEKEFLRRQEATAVQLTAEPPSPCTQTITGPSAGPPKSR